MKPPGAARTYGVLVGRIKDGQEKDGRSPHYEIWAAANGDYRIAVNVRSVDGSDVLAFFDPAFSAPTKLALPSLAAGSPGFQPLPTGPEGRGLDYLRDGLFPLDRMAPIPAEARASASATCWMRRSSAPRPTALPSSSRSASPSTMPALTRHSASRPSVGCTTSI